MTRCEMQQVKEFRVVKEDKQSVFYYGARDEWSTGHYKLMRARLGNNNVHECKHGMQHAFATTGDRGAQMAELVAEWIINACESKDCEAIEIDRW